MKYLIFNKPTQASNLSDFEVCNVVAAEFHHYPNPAGTKRYADPIKHPDGVRIAMAIFETDNTFEMWTKYQEMFGIEPTVLNELSDDWIETTIIV